MHTAVLGTLDPGVRVGDSDPLRRVGHGVRVCDSDPELPALPLLLGAGMPIQVPSTKYSLLGVALSPTQIGLATITPVAPRSSATYSSRFTLLTSTPPPVSGACATRRVPRESRIAIAQCVTSSPGVEVAK